jgi:hypothetical protein
MERYGEINIDETILNEIISKYKNFNKDDNYIVHNYYYRFQNGYQTSSNVSFYIDNFFNCYQRNDNSPYGITWSGWINPSEIQVGKSTIDKIKKLDINNFFSLIPQIIGNQNRMDNLIYKSVGMEEELKKIRIGYNEIPIIKSKIDKILSENNFVKPDSYSLSMIVKVIEKVSDENQKLKTRLKELEEKIMKYDKIFDKIDKSNELIESNLSRIISRYET